MSGDVWTYGMSGGAWTNEGQRHMAEAADPSVVISGSVMRAMRTGGRLVSQQELAARIGIPQPMISMLERERMGEVEYRLAARILRALAQIRGGG